MDSEDKPIEQQNKVNRDFEDQDKIVIKRYELPGVDMSINDLEMLHTVKIKVTKVTKKMFKKSPKTFIGTKDQLDDMDVIQVGNMGIKYRVMKLVKMTDREGYIYRVKRVDGANTTALDMDNIEVGMKVLITNRKTFDELMHHPEDLRDMEDQPHTYCPEDAVVCDTNTPATVQGNPIGSYLANVANNVCTRYAVVVPGSTFDGSTRYLDCNLDTVILEHITTKLSVEYLICTKDVNSFVHNNFTPISVTDLGPC